MSKSGRTRKLASRLELEVSLKNSSRSLGWLEHQLPCESRPQSHETAFRQNRKHSRFRQKQWTKGQSNTPAKLPCGQGLGTLGFSDFGFRILDLGFLCQYCSKTVVVL